MRSGFLGIAALILSAASAVNAEQRDG